MPTSGIRIVNETNLHSISSFKGFADSSASTQDEDYEQLVATAPVTLNSVLVMENIEPGSLHLSNTTNHSSTTGKTFVNLDTKAWQGGFSTIVSPTNAAGGVIASETPVFAEIQSNMVPRRVGGATRRSIKVEEEMLTPEEQERLALRRERNKLAAARCRKRRVDQTDSLQSQVDTWEEKKRLLQAEIHALQTQREELQFILDTHKSVCTRQQPQLINNPTTTCTINRPTASLPNNNTSITNNNTIANTTAACIAQTSRQQHVLSVPKVVVKCEQQQNQQQPNAVVTDSGSVDLQYLVNHLTHEEALNMPLSSPTNTNTSSSSVPSPASSLASPPRPQLPASIVPSCRPARPATLSLSIKPQCLRSIEGIPIETPTNVFNSLNFDALMDGRTGLTPTNVLTPVSITMSAASLQTPTMMMPTPTGCSSQQRNNNLQSAVSPANNNKPKLVSL